jgi:uncharacterized membrane protein YagU involved in acid resistance
MARLVRRDIAVGTVAGFFATLATDRVEALLIRMTPDSELAREPEIPEGSSSGSAARMLLERLGLKPHGRSHRATKAVVHYGLGAAWGPLYCLCRRRAEMHPIAAGALAGTSLALIVDELMNSTLGTTPPSTEFPASSHVRGLVTHLIWGVVAAAVAESLYRMTDD